MIHINLFTCSRKELRVTVTLTKARKNQVIVSAAALCMSMLLYTGVAADKAAPAPPTPRPKWLSIPGIFPPFTGIDIQKCWSSILSVEGCFWEISIVSNSGVWDLLAVKLSSALTRIAGPRCFHSTPTFPSLLKSTCSRSPPPPKL